MSNPDTGLHKQAVGKLVLVLCSFWGQGLLGAQLILPFPAPGSLLTYHTEAALTTPHPRVPEQIYGGHESTCPPCLMETRKVKEWL